MLRILTAFVALAALLAGCTAEAGPIPAPFKSVPTTLVDAPSAIPASPAPVDTLTPSPHTETPAGGGTATPAPSPLASATRQVARAIDVANLRAGPGTDHPVVGQVKPGQELDVMASSPAKTWLELSDGKWIYAELVENVPVVPIAPVVPTAPLPTSTNTPRPATPVPTATRPRPTPQPTVTASGNCSIVSDIANVRAGPGPDYDIAMLASQGMSMRITAKTVSGDWIAVVTPYGVSGWVFGEYCR